MGLAVALIATFVVAGSVLAVCQTETTLYSFTNDPDGAYPDGGLVADANGALYGTTFSGGYGSNGTIFQLVPPVQQGGAWTENVLYRFTLTGEDGANPIAGLILDKAGNLYGTNTTGPTGCGTAFELSPPAVPGGAWTETNLHEFTFGNDGCQPYASLVMDKVGALYGTTLGGGIGGGAGTVFKLTPPGKHGGQWTEKILYTFTEGSDGGHPLSNLVFHDNGILYGTTQNGGMVQGGFSGYGVVFKLTPPKKQGGSWTESVVYTFTGGADGGIPSGGIIFDKNGNLYGTTAAGGITDSHCAFGSCGVVFELSLKSGVWREKVLHRFTGKKDGGNPELASLLISQKGTLFGVTFEGGEPPDCPNQSSGCGVVFKLTPVAGKVKWSEKVLYTFTNGTDGALPTGTLIFNQQGNLYGTAEISQGYGGFGTFFEIKP